MKLVGKMKWSTRLKQRSKRIRHGLGVVAKRTSKAGHNLAPWATVIAAVVAVISFYYGYRQFRETQEATRQTLELQRVNLSMQKNSLELDRDFKAVELLVKYNDLMKEADSTQSSAKPESLFWLENSAFTIAESIFKLKSDDEGWRETVRWMLGNHKDFLKGPLDCKTYDQEFVQFARKEVPIQCSP